MFQLKDLIIHLTYYDANWSQLQSAALATIVALVVITVVGICLRKASMLSNLLIDIFLSILWVVAFSLLSNAMRSTLLRECTVILWGDDQGVRICVLYKLLFAVTLAVT